ncbi:hypothetical protein GS506_13585 [Rhodococcus hoagii]|nr:hypothetical protein [Prescottella equi]
MPAMWGPYPTSGGASGHRSGAPLARVFTGPSTRRPMEVKRRCAAVDGV